MPRRTLASDADASDADAIVPVAVGTIAWAIALGYLVIRGTDLAAAGHSWWIGAALVGLVSGLLGLVFLGWRRRRGAG